MMAGRRSTSPSGFDTAMFLLVIVFAAVMVTLFVTGVLPLH